MGLILSVAAFVFTCLLARRSLVRGIVSCVAFGYFFGIVRANFPGTASFFIFDAAVLGLYCGQLPQLFANFDNRDGQHLKHWIALLTFWPLILFFVPQQDYLVQLVGLRGNVFLLPFVLIGARLGEDEAYDLARCLACLNLIAFFIAGAEFILGVARFFPQNQLTYMIFHSSDVGIPGAFRIPSTFSNAHSFGGMMALSVPWIAGAWIQSARSKRHKNLLLAGLICALLGVLMSAARIDFIILALLMTIFIFSAQVQPTYRVGWLVLLVAIGGLVATNERLQRFTTLGDPQVLTSRLTWGVNTNLLRGVVEYPFGVGLGGGGTSMPYFLEDRVERPLLIESEIGRIQLETGLVGLTAWLAFASWTFTRPRPPVNDPWFLGKRLAWLCALSFFITGLVGIGLMTAIPCSAVLLMSLGWIANAKHKPQLCRSAARLKPQPLVGYLRPETMKP